MSDVVVDSSVAAKWVLDEGDSPQADRVVADVGAKGGRLIALDLAFVEVANAAFLRMPVHVERTDRLLKPALEIAAKYDRAVYDALFVALCQDLGLPGVTADEPLQKAVHPDFPNIVLLRDW